MLAAKILLAWFTFVFLTCFSVDTLVSATRLLWCVAAAYISWSTFAAYWCKKKQPLVACTNPSGFTKTDDFRAFCRRLPTRSQRHRARKYYYLRWLRYGRKGLEHFQEFVPQTGRDSVSSTLQKLAHVKGISLDEATTNKIENLVALFFALKDCVTVSQFTAILFLYIKTHYSVSVASKCMEFLANDGDLSFIPNAAPSEVSKGSPNIVVTEERPWWLQSLKECHTNWTLVVCNPGFKKISKVLSMCLALGLCDASNLDFEVAGMKLFVIEAYRKQITAIDMIDAAFDTFIHC